MPIQKHKKRDQSPLFNELEDLYLVSTLAVKNHLRWTAFYSCLSGWDKYTGKDKRKS